ncbi:hypothetical protein PWG15_07510 [Ensifer adhaerens]|uniref:hypothetical protein n=1 Tax=Ensifer adhaerens TaxID=106592 RepID=UPI0023A96E30|nr:hypothetical protein [Ensifer adhaerens]WDZ78322.1 hypothetical protein PWG15_07510 [Ensifer adhaerens]
MNRAFVPKSSKLGDHCHVFNSPLSAGCGRFASGARSGGPSIFERGVILCLGLYPRGSDSPLYMSFASDDWKSLEVGKEYDRTFRFDKSDPWSAAATAAGDESGKFLFVNVTDPEFLTGFVRKRALAIAFDERVVANLSLRGTGPAAEELMKCQRAVDEIIADEDRKSKEKKADPFNAPSEKRSARDPFSL